MGRNVIPLFIIVSLILIVPCIIAQPPFEQTTQFDRGLAIKVPMGGVLKQNTDQDFHFHVFNITDGQPMNQPDHGVACYFHLYNNFGGHLVQLEAEYDNGGGNNVDNEWEVEILGANFSEIGDYSYIIQCNSTILSLGGYESIGFEITPTGEKLDTSKAIVYSIMLLGITALFIFMFYWMLSIEWSNKFDDHGEIASVNQWKYLKLFLIPVNYVLLMWIFGVARSVSANYLYLPGPTLVFNWAFWILLSFALPLTIVGLFYLIIMFINDKRIYNAIERGTPF